MQDANIFVSENDALVEHAMELGPGRQAYLVNTEGSLGVNGTTLAARDAMALVADAKKGMALRLRAGLNGAHFMLIEMAAPA